MKLIELVNARKALANVAKVTALPFPVAYKITKFFKGTNEDEEFYNEKISELLKQNGEDDGEGKVVIPKEKVEEVNKLATELADTEVEDSGIKFSANDFATIQISVQDCAALLPIMEE